MYVHVFSSSVFFAIVQEQKMKKKNTSKTQKRIMCSRTGDDRTIFTKWRPKNILSTNFSQGKN